ncbi:MAG: hypothetical protein K2H87_01155 [Duncaniella sp.]|nr:hypothetical protein [Duncaniella sp.]
MKRIMIPMAVAVAAAIVTGARAEVSPKDEALAEIAACDSVLARPDLSAAERDSVLEEKAYQYALATMYAMRADEYKEALAYIDSGLPIATDLDVRGPLLTFRAKAYTFLGDDGLNYARY